MSSHAPAAARPPLAVVPSATDQVFETLLADIVRGVYPPGARLPAERDLAHKLGASRPTLREALRRLAAWNLCESRRGSGVVIRERTAWSIEVLPACLRYAGGIPGERTARVLADLLSLRRALACEIVRIICGRLDPESFGEIREAIAHAWSLRADGAAFAAADLDVLKVIASHANFLPAVWMLNRLGGVYLDIARTVSGAIACPDDYLAFFDRLLAALAAHDAVAAVAELSAYLGRHDDHLTTLLEALP
ncbi:MAG TPA: GntR family transcriptional regulator [Kofleriaceae bacterium]|nr:GntR family transcriptional regulator [Kofleriaceae bacterium]